MFKFIEVITLEFINQMEPYFDDNERRALDEYMKSGGWVTEFKKTREFEASIAKFVDAKHCSVLCNGTMSLVVALLACGISVGDEVIVPDYTMVATSNAVELIGAKAVFVDIDPATLCMDFEKMKAAITLKTKAVLLVSINGRYPKEMMDFVAFCKEKGLFLIEDAAQSLGSYFNGKHLGTFGDIGSFSFSAPKIITTGQGGALITNNDELFEKIKKIRDFGRSEGGKDHYLTKGWNFKFTDIQAVIGLEQMKKLPERIEKKRRFGKLYDDKLKNIKGVKQIFTNYEDTTPWFFDILCDKRAELIAYLKDKGIGTRPFYPALHSEPAYGYQGDFPNTEMVAQKGLWLPSSCKLTESDIDYVCDCIRKFYQ